MAVLGALNIVELALKNKGLLPASPSRVDDMENPTCFWFFVNSPPPSNTHSAVHMFSISAEKVAAVIIVAAADSNNSSITPIYVGYRICCAKPFDGWCTPNTEHVRDHNRVRLSQGEFGIPSIGVIPIQSHALSSR